MNPLPLEKETILVRVNGIQGELSELRRLAKISLNDFSPGDPYKLAQYHLHRALEGVFHISAHLLSRLPGGGGGGTYKEMAKLLGEKGIVTMEYASNNLKKMAGYRNRLVHFYSEITPQELHQILNNNLEDIEVFLKAVKSVLQDPKKFGFPALD